MASPPKPWERAGAASGVSVTSSATNTTSNSTSSPSTSSQNTPALPDRPSSLAATVNQNAAAYSRPMTNPYSAYGTAYSAPYTSPYSRLGAYGAYGTGMYGTYGGYGNMYGGGMYPGMPGMPGNDPNSLTSRFNQSTAATFQMLEGVVGAFGGFAQMLESTYMATHSSFYAMISVAEQFGNLRDTLGSILGIFALLRWLRTLFAKVTGRPPPADATSLTPASFARFEGRQVGPDGKTVGPPRASRKPLLFFLVAAFGLPYLMSKVIKTLAATHEEEERRRLAAGDQALQLQKIDPAKVEYCQVMFDYTPQPGTSGMDLQVRKGDLVAVLDKNDPFGSPSEWWRCRTRDARVGYLPSTFLEVLKRAGQPVAAIKATAASDSSRANSLTSLGDTVSSSTPVPVPVPVPASVPVTAESFQRSQFYS